MPAVRRISRDAIVDAAVEVLREGGFSAVNARSVAKKLGCSTQPIYSSFQNMDELKAALRARAIALHTQRVQDSLRAHEGNDTRYSSYGMGFVKFAAEEKQLFRWLYLEGDGQKPLQQDVLLPSVERGDIILIGITTENPYFYINTALLSRFSVFEFKPLGPGDLRKILFRAAAKENAKLTDEATEYFIVQSNGDGRKMLNALEIAVLTTEPDGAGIKQIDLEIAKECIQKRHLNYDKKGDEHYDIISAFISINSRQFYPCNLINLLYFFNQLLPIVLICK